MASSTEILFLTNFSDACFKATRAVAQMADDFALRLTLLYAYDPALERRAAAEEKIASFFPEADHYRDCRRVAFAGDVVTAVNAWGPSSFADASATAEGTRSQSLVVAPVPDRALPRLLPRSTRARIVRDCGLTLWTGGRALEHARTSRPPKNVACWVDFDELSHVREAASYARNFGATLRLLHVLPDVSEGELTAPPLLDEEMLRAQVGIIDDVQVHVAPTTSALAALVRECDADLLFVNERLGVQRSVFTTRLHPIVQRVPCPTIFSASRAR